MKHIIKTIIIVLVFSYQMAGQQVANSTHISEARTYWNPAFTAVGNDMIFDGFFRMQWIGFSGAPVSGFASFQYPLLDYNMSGGVLLNFDKTGPVSKLGVQLNYAYKLKEALSKYGQLSLGISANFQQYVFNGSNEIFNQQDDPLIFRNRSSSFYPSIGGGFFYTSNVREYKGNTFFVGAAMNHIYSSQVLINDFDQVRQKHIHLNVGGRFYSYDTYLEPMITANIVNPDIIDVLYSLKFEKENAFWAGLGFSGAGIMALQGGVIMDRFGNRYAKLKIGVLANYGISSALSNAGPGIEFYIGYNFDMK
jgi:type IX secretion system PorP/SprF family membrane protein